MIPIHAATFLKSTVLCQRLCMGPRARTDTIPPAHEVAVPSTSSKFLGVAQHGPMGPHADDDRKSTESQGAGPCPAVLSPLVPHCPAARHSNGMPRPIKLRLNGRVVHLVPTREVQRWTGFLNAAGAARELLTPDTVADIRRSLMMPRTSTRDVYIQLTKELEDGGAYFFEVTREHPAFDSPPETDIFSLIPDGERDGSDQRDQGRNLGAHWISITCLSPSGQSFAGARVRFKEHGKGYEFGTLNSQSCLHLAELSDDGTFYFELSADARAGDHLRPPNGTRYDLGAPIGLTTGREHVLVVHPNPRARVTASLFVGDEPVTSGEYTLNTPLGEATGQHDTEPARVEGSLVPTNATYRFRRVAPPLPTRKARTTSDTDPGDQSSSADRNGAPHRNADTTPEDGVSEGDISVALLVEGDQAPALLSGPNGMEQILRDRLEFTPPPGSTAYDLRGVVLPLPKHTSTTRLPNADGETPSSNSLPAERHESPGDEGNSIETSGTQSLTVGAEGSSVSGTLYEVGGAEHTLREGLNLNASAIGLRSIKLPLKKRRPP